MAKGYWVFSSKVSDIERFKDYASRTGDILEKYGGKFLVRAGHSEIVEGNPKERNAIIEFPSYSKALECWYSAEYQEVKKIREGAAEVDVVIIEGLLE